MHVCFALLTGWSMSALTSRRCLRMLWRLYPAAIIVVVVVTGNHYLVDIVLGAAVAGVSALVAGPLLGRARPDVWAFGEVVP
jgi:membrane-associated phospholipid phosphatase